MARGFPDSFVEKAASKCAWLLTTREQRQDSGILTTPLPPGQIKGRWAKFLIFLRPSPRHEVCCKMEVYIIHSWALIPPPTDPKAGGVQKTQVLELKKRPRWNFIRKAQFLKWGNPDPSMQGMLSIRGQVYTSLGSPFYSQLGPPFFPQFTGLLPRAMLGILKAAWYSKISYLQGIWYRFKVLCLSCSWDILNLKLSSFCIFLGKW
jgi:hypothetical protein